jgi:(2Fe-2S) ferredoxin
MPAETNPTDKIFGEPEEQELREIAKRLGLSKAKAHILFCAGEKCCDAADGLRLWEHLKKACGSLAKTGIVLNRSKTTCLRFCRSGPILVVYPQGAWYACVTEAKIEEILRALAAGLPLPDGSFFEAPLS